MALPKKKSKDYFDQKTRLRTFNVGGQNFSQGPIQWRKSDRSNLEDLYAGEKFPCEFSEIMVITCNGEILPGG